MAEVGTLTANGTEQTVVETAVNQDGHLEAVVDLSAMLAGDSVTIRVYLKVDGTNYRLADSITYTGAQAQPVAAVEARWINAAMDGKVTLTQTAGTYRAFAWRSRVKY